MQIKTKAGEFTLTSNTDGFPYWTSITYHDVVIRIHHSELRDLAYAAEAHRDRLKAQTSETDRFEI